MLDEVGDFSFWKRQVFINLNLEGEGIPQGLSQMEWGEGVDHKSPFSRGIFSDFL